MGAVVLLRPRFHPPRSRRELSEHDPAPAQAFLEGSQLSLRDGGSRGHQSFVLRIARRIHRLLENPDRVRLRSQDPVRLLVADCDRGDHFRLARGDLSAPEGLAQERSVPQVAREPRLLHRRAGVHPQLFARVVPDIRIAQVERAAPDLQAQRGRRRSPAPARCSRRRCCTRAHPAPARWGRRAAGRGCGECASPRWTRPSSPIPVASPAPATPRPSDPGTRGRPPRAHPPPRRPMPPRARPCPGRAPEMPVESLAGFAGREVVAIHAAIVQPPPTFPGADEPACLREEGLPIGSAPSRRRHRPGRNAPGNAVDAHHPPESPTPRRVPPPRVRPASTMRSGARHQRARPQNPRIQDRTH